MARRTAKENRSHVLQVASALFYRQGIRAVGMDQIVKEAGVGNATVYRQFPTKDELAAAYVQERADAWFERMRAAADGVEDPRAKVLVVFSTTAADIEGPTSAVARCSTPTPSSPTGPPGTHGRRRPQAAGA